MQVWFPVYRHQPLRHRSCPSIDFDRVELLLQVPSTSLSIHNSRAINSNMNLFPFPLIHSTAQRISNSHFAQQNPTSLSQSILHRLNEWEIPRRYPKNNSPAIKISSRQKCFIILAMCYFQISSDHKRTHCNSQIWSAESPTLIFKST